MEGRKAKGYQFGWKACVGWGGKVLVSKFSTCVYQAVGSCGEGVGREVWKVGLRGWMGGLGWLQELT